MRPFNDLLVCGISSQLRPEVEGFDETISTGDPDFDGTGLAVASLIRLEFVTTVPLSAVKGSIGAVNTTRYRRLLGTLAGYLSSQAR